MQVDIVCGVGRVYVNCWLVLDIVGEPAPCILKETSYQTADRTQAVEPQTRL
jgi:hypothetical protein